MVREIIVFDMKNQTWKPYNKNTIKPDKSPAEIWRVKKMKKKMISMFLAASMTAALFAGCGSGGDAATDTGAGNDAKTEDAGKDQAAEKESEPAEDAGDAAGAEGEKVALKWAIWDKDTAPYWQALVDAYEEKNPNVTIEMTDLGSADYSTVIATELSGSGSDFDIVSIKDVPGYATLVEKGVLEPLNERIKSDGIDLGLYNGATDQVMVDGSLYELPFRSDFWLLYYNKDIFDKAGVSYPTNDMTMEQWDELARSVSGGGFGADQVYGSHYHTWRSAVQLFGILDGQHSVLDGNYDFAKPYYELVKKQEEDGVCRSYVDINASSLHYSAAFSEGNTATLNMGSWFVTSLIDNLKKGEYDASLCGNWGIVKYPHPEGVTAGTTLGTITALAIPTVSDQKDAAWDFIKFASGEEGAAVIADTGTFPAIINDDVVNKIASLEGFPTDAESKEALKTSQIYLEAPYNVHISEINTILDTYHTDIMNGDVSIDDGIAKMNEEVSAILGE